MPHEIASDDLTIAIATSDELGSDHAVCSTARLVVWTEQRRERERLAGPART
jgi:hypothetical protein